MRDTLVLYNQKNDDLSISTTIDGCYILLCTTNEITKSNTKFCSDIYNLFKNV